MALFPDVSKVVWFDVETGGLPRDRSFHFTLPEFQRWSRLRGREALLHPYAKFHASSPLLQLYASGIPHFQHLAADEHLADNTHIALPAHRTIYEHGEPVDLILSKWAEDKGLLKLSAQAKQTEKEALLAFFGGLEQKLAADGKVALGGWNIGYDLTSIERAARRYDDLGQYHGWIGAQMDAGKLQAVEAYDLFADLTLRYAQQNEAFGKSLRMGGTGKIATTAEELRRVPGWKLEHLITALGGPNALGLTDPVRYHSAAYDTKATAQVYQRLLAAHAQIEGGEQLETAFSRAGLLSRAKNPEQLFSWVYRESQWAGRFEAYAARGEAMGEQVASALEKVSYRRTLAAGGLIAGAAVAAGLAFGRRSDRQTQITGLSDLGAAAGQRHRHSDFGSGWRGLDDDSPTLNWSRLAVGTGLYAGYRAANAYRPQQMARGVRWVESRFPHHMLNYFGLGQWQAGYLQNELHWGLDTIVDSGGLLTGSGEHMQRLFGGGIDLAEFARQNRGLHFTRKSSWSPYYSLEGTDYSMRFVAAEKAEKADRAVRGSRWAGASERWNAPLGRPSRYVPKTSFTGTLRERWTARFEQFSKSMTPINPKEGLVVGDRVFQPLFGLRESEPLTGLKQRAGIIALEMAEAPQHLFARFGVGLKAGDWNSAGSLVKGLLLKRALPVAAGLLALDYADYLTGHHLSSAVLGIGPKLNLARAEATDRVPGARRVTDWYEDHVPGPQFAPLALPAAGVLAGGTAAWLARISTENAPPHLASKWMKAGGVIGGLLALPFLPGMLGSRKTADELRDIYSGDEPVPIRSGRWWDQGTSPIEGGRIKMYRPHWFARLKARPERVSLRGSEEEYWRHHPILHPLRWLKDPYSLERETYADRPYPVTSPAGSNIPLIGPLVSATLGKLIKPPVRMHEEEWSGTDYTLFSSRVEPRGPQAIHEPYPQMEYSSVGELMRRQGEVAAEFLGLSGFIGKTFWNKVHPDGDFGKRVFFQGSRQMTSLSRKYYEQEVGALWLPEPGMEMMDRGPEGMTGYSEALRRFVQRDLKTLQANEIPNNMPDWLPGNDYFVDLRSGDPYTKIPSGASRLPGPAYEALHPELKGVDPADYPLLTRFAILSDVAPWSAQWFQHKAMADSESRQDAESRIRYEQILDRAEAMKKSSEPISRKRFTLPVEKTTGVVRRATPEGLELEGGRKVKLSAVGSRMADLSSVILGEQNGLTRAQVAREAERRREKAGKLLGGLVGREVELVVPKGAAGGLPDLQAVVRYDGRNINRELIDEGLAAEKPEEAGPEYQAMDGAAGRALGAYGESISKLTRLMDTPIMPGMAAATKVWHERDALEQYRYNELYGSRMQRWETPVKSFMAPWFRDLAYKLTGNVIVPKQVQEKRDLDTLTDMLEYLRTLQYTNKSSRSATGADVMGDASYLRSTLSGRDKYYFEAFLSETDPEKRSEILDSVGPEFGRILEGQWVKREAAASGGPVPRLNEGGWLLKKEETDAYADALEAGETRLDFGDWERSREIAGFFHRRNLRLPEDPDSPVFDENIDYEDVKAKIVDEEGLEMHDYNIFEDRSSLLWRKPYLDGAVRELTEGDDRPVEELRRSVERMILDSHDRKAQVRAVSVHSHQDRSNITLRLEQQPDREILRDIRRHREEYQPEETIQ